MEQSPLTQQARPETFEPKVVQLYRQLLDGEDDEKSEGFWRELFLLNPDHTRLSEMLEDMSAVDLLQLQHHTQHLILEATAYIKAGNSPADEHALDTLTIFLGQVLSKRYTNPSSDIIEVLAGLDDVDSVFTDLVATLDSVIRAGRTVSVRQKAVQAALCVASGAFQTSLLTYFTQRDLFPSLMKLIHDLEDPLEAARPFLLAGLLANYNKFEARNPYHVRFADFVNEDTIKKIVRCVGRTCDQARDQYVAIQDDIPEAWSVSSTLSYLGLGALGGYKPAAPVLTEQEIKAKFAEQPLPDAAVLLAMYDFSLANKIFCLELVRTSTENKQQTCCLGSFLSLSSYLYQHAHRSPRAASYAHLSLLITRILIEDAGLAKRLCETPSTIRLCRQRPPHLPLAPQPRLLAAHILDIAIDNTNHNLRKKLDMDLYILNLGILLRLVAFLAKAKIRLQYHWPELWRSLLSFIRFLTAYVDDVRALPRADELIGTLVALTTLCLTQGDAFLPDSAAYDDLVYKLVETGDALASFRDAYALTAPKTEPAAAAAAAAMATLIAVSGHYSGLIEKEKEGNRNLSPREVGRIIKAGYETLSIEVQEGLDGWERYREGDHRGLLKRVVRGAVGDARELSVRI